MPTRLVRLPARGQLDLLAEHAKRQHAEGRSVLLVTASHPAPVIARRFADLGVNMSRVFIMDAVGSRAGVERTTDPDHLMYVPAPTQLELIVMRARKTIREKAEGPPTVLVCTVNAFGLYNSTESLEEMVRYIVHSLARPDAMIDFVLEEDAPVDQVLVAFLETFVDQMLSLRPA